MFGLGVTEIIIIAVILLLLFGAKRLPDIGAGLGQTVRELGKIKKDLSKDKKSDKNAEVSEESEPESTSLEGKVGDSLQKKVTDKMLGQVPGIKQAKQVKDKADRIKKIIS